MTEFQILELEVVAFMRGNYLFDEVSGTDNGIPCLKFCQGENTIVKIILHHDSYDFHFELNEKEYEEFCNIPGDSTIIVQKICTDEANPKYTGTVIVHVCNVDSFQDVKKIMHIKKKPDRKPLPKEDAVYGKCGNRCDLCIHYDKISEEFRNKLVPHLSVVYNTSDFTMRCSGCDTKGCHCHVSNELCPPLKCIHQNELKSCFDCKKYPCETAIVGYRQLDCKSISADDVTWGILPYVSNQYETK